MTKVHTVYMALISQRSK